MTGMQAAITLTRKRQIHEKDCIADNCVLQLSFMLRIVQGHRKRWTGFETAIT